MNNGSAGFGIRNYYYIFMTAPVDFGPVVENGFPLNNFRTTIFSLHARAFGNEPNALPKLGNCLRTKNFGSPGKTRTCNPSVNSRTLYH